MKTGTLLKRWSAALVAIIMMISLFAIPAFAHEDGTTDGTTEVVENTTEAAKKLDTTTIVLLIIAGVIVVIGTILIVKYRVKVAKFFRALKSEVKKIVWLPWDQTRKNTWVVLVILILFAVAICAIDFGLQKGILAFLNNLKPDPTV